MRTQFWRAQGSWLGAFASTGKEKALSLGPRALASAFSLRLDANELVGCLFFQCRHCKPRVFPLGCPGMTLGITSQIPQRLWMNQKWFQTIEMHPRHTYNTILKSNYNTITTRTNITIQQSYQCNVQPRAPNTRGDQGLGPHIILAISS